MPEAVMLEESELTAIRKAEFAETLRARLSEKVLAEIRLLADMLEGAIARVVFEGKGAEAVSENLEEFSRAVSSAIAGWEAEPGNIEKLGREERVGVLDVRGLALIAITKVSKDRTESYREEPMTIGQFRKASDVVEAATREAEKLMKAAPEKYPNIVAARAQVWRDRPDLADAFASLPADDSGATVEKGAGSTNVSKLAPVEKGQGPLDRATAKAQELMAANPDRYQSIEQARAQVWKTFPQLAEEYQKELAG